MHVRPAHPADAEAIAALYRLLVPGDPHIAVEPARLAELADNPTNHLLVLDLDGEVRGTAFLTICLDSMYRFAPYGLLENVIIAPASQRQGAGRALLAAAEQIARSARCTKLMLLSGNPRSEAHRFFTALGYDGGKKRGFVKYLNRTLPLG